VNVAVVLPELDPRSGGGFAFQETLFATLRALEGETAHQFVYYSPQIPDAADESFVRFRNDKRAAAGRRFIQLVRDCQDRSLGLRVFAPRTWFERALRRNRIDLVWFATPFAQDCERPYIFTVWDLEFLDQPWFPEVSRDGEWQRRDRHYSRYIPPATRVIVPSEAGRDQLLRHFSLSPERVLVLHHPTPGFADADSDAGDVGGKYGIQSPYLFYPAQYWSHKNHVTLLHALKKINEEGSERFEVVCVGSDKGAFGHVQRLVGELGLDKEVRLLNFVPNDELVWFYRNAFALTYLSFFGPENLPPLEAFALGCPVVCGDIPGAREQLGDGALFVPPSDSEAVAEAVLRLRDDELRRRLVDAGRERAQEFTSEAYVRGVFRFLDEFELVRKCWSS
jgi:glycosyltransferase involved in cell wall biosynthesis